ncbi:MAG: ATP-binding protein [Candidatus Omnitrophota bacterium]
MLKIKITAKFIISFLVVALIPLAIATYISYNSSRKALQEEVSNSLLAVADNKANQLETYLNEQEKNASTLAHMSDTLSAIERYNEAFYSSEGMDGAEYEEVDSEFRSFFSYYQKSSGYDDLYLVSPKGNILFSVKKREDLRSLYEVALYEASGLADVFIKSKESLRIEISDFEYSTKINKPIVYISAPIFKRAEFIGAVVLEMTNEGIARLVKDYTGLGETGEVIVASDIDNKAVVITPLRFDEHAEFIRKVPLGSKVDLDIQRAVKGEEGIGAIVDSRGKEVLSVWRYLPLFRLGLVVKMDTQEILASADRLRNTLLKISLGLLLLVIILAVLIAHSISSPIKELTKVSSSISSGNLSARADIKANDEIGDLAKTFNEMTNKLVEAKASLEEQKGLLEKANKELDSFVYTASHDLRAPLRAISSFAAFLEEDYQDKLDDGGRDHIREIKEGAARMNRLIEDLLALSRITRIKNPFEDVNMNTLVTEVIKQIEFDIKRSNVEVKVLEYLPTIHCDRIKISAAFLNLINNAVKFSSKNNKERPRVEIGYQDEKDAYKFFVKDNGIGIAPKYHKQIFGIFKRLHSAEEYDGTGAGLSIVKRVVDDHNGKLWIESDEGKGAAFFFTIPKTLKQSKKIGEILVKEGAVSEEDLEKALEKQHGDMQPPKYKGETKDHVG